MAAAEQSLMNAADIPTGKPSALDGLGRMSPVRQISVLVGLAVSVALGVWVAMWSQTPNYSLLYGSLSGQDSSAVMAALDQAEIPYRVDHQSGALMVPGDRVHQARIKLAASGLPKGSSLGFEVLQKQQGFGTSQFIERARYLHALETELARSIGALDNVDSARVHLAVPRQSAFLKKRREPSASVLVQLAPGRKLGDGQVGAVAHLVASAVANLDPSKVRVVDGAGRLLSEADGGDELGVSRRELDFTRTLEASFVKRIEQLLAPIVGVDGVKAEVAAELDYTMTEQSTESFDPRGQMLRSEQLSEDLANARRAAGVPGALSNQPPVEAQAPEEVANAVARGERAEPPGQKRSRATRNYELDRTISHVRTPSGRVVRLSVAVVIDDRKVVGADGSAGSAPRTPEEMARFTSLVKDAVGFNDERGDSVNVVNAAFAPPEVVEAIPEVPIWQQPWVWDIARQLGGALLVLIFGLGVLRPVMRNLVAREVAERELAQVAVARLTAPEREGGEEGAGEAAGDEAGGERSPAMLTANSREERLETIRSIVNDDPRIVANMMKNWVTEGA